MNNKLLLKVASLAAIVPIALGGLAACADKEVPQSEPKREKPKGNGGNEGGGGGLPFGIGGEGGEQPPFGGGGTEPTEDPFGGGGGVSPTDPYGGGGVSPTDPYGGGGSGGGSGSDGSVGTVRFGKTDLSKVDWHVTCLTGENATISGTENTTDPTADGPGFLVMFEGDEPSTIMISESLGSTTGDAVYWSSVSAEGKVDAKFDGKNLQVKGQAPLNFQEPVDFEITATCNSSI